MKAASSLHSNYDGTKYVNEGTSSLIVAKICVTNRRFNEIYNTFSPFGISTALKYLTAAAEWQQPE